MGESVGEVRLNGRKDVGGEGAAVSDPNHDNIDPTQRAAEGLE